MMPPPLDTEHYDPEAVRAKYLAERDKRLVAGRADIRDLRHDEYFAKYRDDPFTPATERDPVVDEVDVVILGGGIAGVTTGAHLRQAGIERIRIIDQAGGIGGTWYWNRYPGVMCDVESYIYMPMLEEIGYVPSQRYAFGEEILRHLEAVAEHYDLVDDALFHTGVTRAEWREEESRLADPHRPRRRHHVPLVRAGARHPQPDEAACPQRHGGLRRPLLPHGALGLRLHRRRPPGPAREPEGQDGGADRHRCLGHPVPASAGRIGQAGLRLPAHPLGHRRAGQPPDRRRLRATLEPGWQRARNDNFQAIMLGRPAEVDQIDDGWTHHYAVVNNPPRRKGMSLTEFIENAEAMDYEIMDEHRRRVDALVEDPDTAEILKPYYRYICKRPCFHDEYLSAYNSPNVTLIDCPAGMERITEAGPLVNGQEYAVDCIVYGTGFEPERTPLYRRAGHDIVGRDGVTLAEKWADGAASLYGIMSRGFPNLFLMPAPTQQAVVTVNYTQLAVAGAEFVTGAISLLRKQGVEAFDVSAQAEEAWTQKIVDSYVAGTTVMAACTPSRINNEGHPETINPRDGNYGGGFGDWFGYRDLLERWVADGRFEGLELEVPSSAP